MFIHLFYLLLNMKLTFSTIIIQNAGIYDIKYDDIAMIFYLTVENSYNHKIHVSVCGVKCAEGYETVNHMFLLGGDMGYLESKSIKNLTLIYPNLYLQNKVGSCLVTLNFVTDQSLEEIRKEIHFDTNKACKAEMGREGESENPENPINMANSPYMDCVIKYSSTKSYFNKENRRCQIVPECPPNTVYIPKSNTCRKLHIPVCKSDLEMIEDGYIEKCHAVSNAVNFYCHHGSISNATGECVCDAGWTSSTCSEGVYHPTLNLYHMCNIEINTWGRANKEKMLMTILVLIILALAIAAKMLLAVCVLNWCCHFFKKSGTEVDDEEYCGSYNCPYSYCGDEECNPEEDKPAETSSRVIKVSFSNMAGASSGTDDVSVTVDETGSSEMRSKSSRSSKSSSNICHCK